jgi:hypothetical protein
VSFTYDQTITPKVTGITPSWSGTQTGEVVTFSGTNLGSADVWVDDIPCVVSSSSSTHVSCATGHKKGDALKLPIPIQNGSNVKIIVNGKGSAVFPTAVNQYE